MHRKQRWLWPSSQSRFLRNESYRTFSYTSYVPEPSDILLPGSDDEAEQGYRKAKRRRIQRLGRAYLAGQPLLIPSAILKGLPGANDSKHDDFDEDGFCVSAHGDFALANGIEHLHPLIVKDKDVVCKLETSPADAIELVKPRVDELSNDASLGRKTPPGHDHQMEEKDTDKAQPNLNNDGLEAILAGIAEAKRLSISIVHTREVDIEGIEYAKQLSQAVIADASSKSEPGEERDLSGASENIALPHAGILEDILQQTDERGLSSPFMYRRGKRSRRPSSTEEKSPNRTDVVESVKQDELPTRSAQADPELEPTADETVKPSLASCSNARLGRFSQKSETPRSIRKRLRAEMRASGASFEGDRRSSSVTPHQSPIQNNPPNPPIHEAPIADFESGGGFSDALRDEPHRPEVFISTQTALREAHLDLLRSSPIKVLLSPDRNLTQTQSNELSLSPAPVVTPFAKFHETFNAIRESNHDQQLSTQHILNDFSPFQFSPAKEPQTSQMGSFEQATSDQSKGNSITGPGVNTGTGWSFGALDGLARPQKRGSSRQSSQRSSQPSSQRSKVSIGSQSRSNSGLKGMGFKVTKSILQVDTQSTKPKKAATESETSVAKSISEVNRTPSRPQTLSLSQILQDLSPTGSVDQDLNKILSSSSHALLRRSSSASDTRRGQVLDWDKASVASDADPEPPVPDTNLSGVKDSFATHSILPPSKNTHPSFVASKSAKPKVRVSLDESRPSPSYSAGVDATGPTSTARSSLKSALRKTQQSSMQDAQREPDAGSELDLEDSLNELGKSVLGSWDVETAIRKGVQAI